MDDLSKKIEFLRLTVNDIEELIGLIKLYEHVFEMKQFTYPSPTYLERMLKKENTIFMVAKYEDHIIGGLTAHELASAYSETNEVYVSNLAVHPDFRRKGIGTRLIDELKKISCEKSDKEIFLQADIDDTQAIGFYKKIGGVPENVIHFTFQFGCN